LSSQTVWVIGNQLLDTSRAWEHIERDAVIFMAESEERSRLFRYHKKKLTLIFSAMRHYAEQLRVKGRTVDYTYLTQERTFAQAFRRHLDHYHPSELLVMRPADVSAFTAAEELAGQFAVSLRWLPNDLFLTDPKDFTRRSSGKTSLVMEHHYRALRKNLGILVDQKGKPEGGKWNYDAKNRRPYSPRVKPGPVTMFEADDLTRQVMREVDEIFPDHPGSTSGFDYPVSRQQAVDQFTRFIEERLDSFGPYEDMMAVAEPHLYHSLLSPLLNIGLLHPTEVVSGVVEAYHRGDARLESVEAIIRQVIGWREFVYGVSHWLMPGYLEVNYFDSHRPLPGFFWTGHTDLYCLQKVITQTIETGYAHHIQRLMVLANFCTLIGVEPRIVYRWFMEMFVDAYEWVMAPNVLGMGTFADGGRIATKPYVSSGAYINRMSDYCTWCAFDVVKKTGRESCPFNSLYWDFLHRNRSQLEHNPRMRIPYAQLNKKTHQDVQKVRTSAERFLEKLES